LSNQANPPQYFEKHGIPTRLPHEDQATGGAQNGSPATSEETVVNIEMRDGFQSELRILKPADSNSRNGPLVILIYGGGCK
jgi:hypothetical protein